LSKVILSVCKELIDDAKRSCVDMVFKDTCIELLARARLILSEVEFRELLSYADTKMREELSGPEEKLRLVQKSIH
jgi:hypothetical protein